MSQESKSTGIITASGCFKCPEGELSELEVAAARRNFQAYDLDCDGVISREDFHAAMTKYKDQLGHRTPAELDEMYASVDIHGTGQVDFLTFAEMRVRKKNHTAATTTYTTEDGKKKPTMKTWQSAVNNQEEASLQRPPATQNPVGKWFTACSCLKSRA